jgi:hypothetical protein
MTGAKEVVLYVGAAHVVGEIERLFALARKRAKPEDAELCPAFTSTRGENS